VKWSHTEAGGSRSSARFTAVVQKAGRPELLTLWHEPQKDPTLRKAVKENRLLTVKQENVGTKKDFGTVGFEEKSPASYLVFPKSLKEFSSKKIVGIKYDLIAPAKPKGKPVRVKAAEQNEKTSSERLPDKEVRFAVTLECTAQLEMSETVTAKSKKEAEKLARERLEELVLDFSKARKRWRIRKVAKI
jgi:hypothetical protein